MRIIHQTLSKQTELTFKFKKKNISFSFIDSIESITIVGVLKDSERNIE